MKTENANSTIIDGGSDVVDVLNINGIEYSKCDVERLLLESYKFRSLFLENFKITLKELDNILGVNKLYENKLKEFETSLKLEKKDHKSSSCSVQHAIT